MKTPIIDKQITLVDGFVLLRRYDLTDATEAYTAISESLNELVPWFTWCHSQYSIEETKQYLETRDEA